MKTKLSTLIVLIVLAALLPASGQNTFKLSATLNSSSGLNLNYPAEVMATNFAGDGKVDLVCADEVLTNNGKGIFGKAFALPPNFRAAGFVAMDVNQDGKVDLVTLTNLTVSPYTESIVVYTNVGVSSSYPYGLNFGVCSSTINVGNDTASLINGTYQGNGSLAAAGDVSGNGQANLFYENSLSNSLSLYTNNGSGTFGSNTTFNVKMGLPAVADVNRDGSVDFVSYNFSNNIVYVFTNNGGGIYASNAAFKVRAPTGVTAADVNGDGWVDLIVRSTTNSFFNPNYQSNTITIWTNNGSGGFGSNTIFTVGSSLQQYITDVKAAQVFGDGKVDLVVSVSDLSGGYANSLIIFTNNGLGYFGSNTAVSVGSTGQATEPGGVAVADVNGDGTLDLISANNGNSSYYGLTIYTNTGTGLPTGSFLGNAMTLLHTNSSGLLAADLYRTGEPQLITQYNTEYINSTPAAPALEILTNNGSGGFGSNAAITLSGAVNSSSVSGLTAADLFGTGSLDLIGIVNYPYPLYGQLVVLTNNGSGIFGTNLTLGVPYNSSAILAGSVAVADVNGDGKPDVITLTSISSGYPVLTVYTNNGAGGFATNYFGQISTSYAGVGGTVLAADLTGNGRPELIVLNPGTPSAFTVYTNVANTFTNRGVAGPFIPPNNGYSYAYNPTYTLSNNAQSMVVADVNGDGKPDLIFANDNYPGTLTVMTNNGNGGFGFSSSPVVGAFPHALAAADVNGDGKADLISANWGLLANYTDYRGPLGYGTLSVLTNNGSGGFTNIATFSTGPGPTAVIATDVNGDGKPDLITANTTSYTNTASGVPYDYPGSNSLSVLFNTSNFWNIVAFQTVPSYAGITYGQNVNAAGLSGGVATNEAGTVVAGTITFTNYLTNYPLQAGTANYTVTFAATPPTDYQPITYNTSVTISQLVVVLRGSRSYDGTTNGVHSILTVSNRVQNDNVTVTAGSVGFDSANVGTQIITSTNSLVLGGSTAPNYNLSGVSGSIVVSKANNVITLVSSQNPSGHAAGVSFTATLPAYATGTVQFNTNYVAFDTEPLTLGAASSVANTTLPPGASTITAVYSGDANNVSKSVGLIQVVEVPQFNTTTLDPSGLIMSGSFGSPGGTFYLLATTDLTLPLSQWTTVLTNQYDVNGNYNFTNAIDLNAPQMFYLLQSQ